MKQILVLIVAVVCGLTAMLLSRMILKGQRAKLEEEFAKVPVLVAAKDIHEGMTILPENAYEYLAQKSELKTMVTTRHFRPEQRDLVLGKKFVSSVPKEGAILWSDLAGDDRRGGSLASMITKDDRAVSIPVDMTSSVTGLVEPNDHVDILGTFTFPSMKGDPQLDVVTLTILQNVTVLATGRETTRTLFDAMLRGGPKRGASYSTVTLLVSPKEAEMLVFAMQKGRLTLTLRRPDDVGSARDLSSINFNYLEKKVGEFNDARQERLRGSVPP